MFAIFSWIDNNVILISHSKQYVQSQRTRGVLKIERYEQRLTHRACMGEASSYSRAPATAMNSFIEFSALALIEGIQELKTGIPI